MYREIFSSGSMPVQPVGSRESVAINRISWGAIFGGVVVAAVVQMVLSLLGMGIGMGAVNPEEAKPFSGLGTGALIWWVLSMLISLFVGGYVAGRLAGMPRNTEGVLHGVLTWSVFTLFSFFLLTTAVGGVFNVVGDAVSKSISVAGQQQVDPSQAKNKLEAELKERGLSTEEIQKQLQSPDPQVRQKAEDISNATSKAGIFGAIGLILGGIVAGLGGLTGRPRHLLQDVKVPLEERVYQDR